MKTISIFIFCIAQVSFNQITAQGSWNKSTQNGVTLFSPIGLKSGKTFDVYAYGPTVTENEDLKNWVLETAKQQQKTLGNPLKNWTIKPEKEDYSTVNSFVDQNGNTMQVAYQGGKLDDGRNYFLKLITSNDLTTVLKYGAQLDDLLVDIKADLLTKKTTINITNSIVSNQVTPTSNTASYVEESIEELTSGKAPKDFIELRGVLSMGMQASGMFGTTSEVIALFKDGTFTRDLGPTFSKGISVSKSEKPYRWGHWRLRNNELQLKEHDESEYEKVRQWLTSPATEGLKLNNCYGNITSRSSDYYGGGSTVGNASSWCFKPNGRFAHSKTGFANSTGGVSGSTSSNKKNGGRYHLDGYVARFVYDDGTEVITSFCFLNKNKTHIGINGKRFMSN